MDAILRLTKKKSGLSLDGGSTYFMSFDIQVPQLYIAHTDYGLGDGMNSLGNNAHGFPFLSRKGFC